MTRWCPQIQEYCAIPCSVGSLTRCHLCVEKPSFATTTISSTGRVVDFGPNSQNIPVRTEEGRKIREAFLNRGTTSGSD